MADYDLNCSLPIPYPEITATQFNRYDLQMLCTLISRKLYGINEYIMQSILLAEDYPHLADLMDCIAVSESKHFKLLCHLMLLSGEKGCMKNISEAAYIGKGRQMQASYSPAQIITSGIEREKNSVSDIKLVLSQIYNIHLKELLERILLDEEHHIGILSELLLRYT